MSPKHKCHQKWNVNKTKMPPKYKYPKYDWICPK